MALISWHALHSYSWMLRLLNADCGTQTGFSDSVGLNEHAECANTLGRRNGCGEGGGLRELLASDQLVVEPYFGDAREGFE